MGHEGSLVFKVVAREGSDSEKIIGWAKWLLQRPANGDGEAAGKDEEVGERQGALDPEDMPSVDMDMDACRKLADGQYDMLNEVIAGRGCYCKSISDELLCFLHARCRTWSYFDFVGLFARTMEANEWQG